MKPLSLAELAGAVHGRVIGDPELLVGPQVSIDSRRIESGALFVAVPGEQVDGHDYLQRAIDAGASAGLTTRQIGDLPQVVVEDTVRSLGILGRYVLDHSDARVIALTGSQGKTSTKDLLAQIMEAEGPTVAPVGSYNNEYGLPLTATRIAPDTRWLIAEMGARGIGHIAYLCQLTPPQVGAVLNVGQAHIGEFGGRDAIAAAKGELLEALPADGWAVLNADDARVAAMAPRTVAGIARWSRRERPSPAGPLVVWATDEHADAWDRHDFLLNVAAHGEHSRHRVSLQHSGSHQVDNALAAATCALVELGADAAERVAARLSASQARSAWRMEFSTLNPPSLPGGAAEDQPAAEVSADGDVVLINDAYNANPDSMRAALQTLAVVAGQRAGRSIAILGDMLELGSDAEAEHRNLGLLAGELGLDVVIGVGNCSLVTTTAARQAGVEQVNVLSLAPPTPSGVTPYPDGSGTESGLEVSAVAQQIMADLRPGDTVLVKASRGQALERLATALVAHLGERLPTSPAGER